MFHILSAVGDGTSPETAVATVDPDANVHTSELNGGHSASHFSIHFTAYISFLCVQVRIFGLVSNSL